MGADRDPTDPRSQNVTGITKSPRRLKDDDVSDIDLYYPSFYKSREEFIGSQMGGTRPTLNLPNVETAAPADRFILGLKPEDIDRGFMDIQICDLIPKGPNSPIPEHNLSGRRRSALNPYSDFENSCKSAGRLKFMLFTKEVPKTVRNFKALLKAKDGTGYLNNNFHRMTQNFMIQGGDTEHQNGKGGVSIYGRFMPDENFNVKHTHKGMMGMANMGPNTNGSQFYITQKPTPWLDNEHVVFGKIYDGWHVLDYIDKECASDHGIPKKFVTIEKCGVYAKEGSKIRDAKKPIPEGVKNFVDRPVIPTGLMRAGESQESLWDSNRPKSRG